jgi:hypothetical protein
MTTQLQSRERSDAGAQHEWESPDLLFADARRRRRRRWMAGSALIAVSVVAAVLILGMAGGGDGRAGDKVQGQPSGSGLSASSHRRADIAVHHVGVAGLTVSLPRGWHWQVERGNYRNCTRPVGRLDLASYPVPVGFGKHEGAIVVPPNGILLEIVSAPIKSRVRPWNGWHLSNNALRQARNVGPNRYAAEVDLPSSPTAAASAYLGSIPAPRRVLTAANQILRSARIDQVYGCQ